MLWNWLIQIEQIKYIICRTLGMKEGEKDVCVVKLIYIENHFFPWICAGNARLPSITKDSPRAVARTGMVSWISWKNIGGAV